MAVNIRAFFIAFAIWVFVCLCGATAMVYVAVHFLAKYW